MTRYLNLAFSVLLGSATLWLAPTVKADEWDKKTILTFNEPVEIPGQVLQPGTYVFKLANTIDRTTVQVFTEDQQHLIAMFMAAAAYRVQRTDKTVVTFEERSAGSPQAMHAWFYPGDNDGIEFLYPKTKIEYAQTQPAPAPPSPAPAVPAAAPALEQQAQIEQPMPVQQPQIIVRDEEVIIAQAAPLQALEGAPVELPSVLPQTAGNFAGIPLLGLVLLSGGFTALRFATKRA